MDMKLSRLLLPACAAAAMLAGADLAPARSGGGGPAGSLRRFAALPAAAPRVQPGPAQAFFHEDFEGDGDPVEFLASNAKHTVNFQGVTEEKAFSGRKSYKIDVTFHEGSYYFASIPIRAPAEGGLTFSGRILVGEESTGRAALGLGYSIWPCLPQGDNGSRLFPWFRKTGGEWMSVQAGVAERGEAAAVKLLGYHMVGVRPQDVGVWVDRVGIYLSPRGGKMSGGRVVVYIDDLEMRGAALPADAYAQTAAQRWAPVARRHGETIKRWETTLARAETDLAGLTGLSAEAAATAEGWRQRLASVKRDIAEARRQGFIRRPIREAVEPVMRGVRVAAANVKRLSVAGPSEKLLVYRLPPTLKVWVRPQDKLVPGEITDELRVIACPGEYEPATFVVAARSAVKELLVRPSDLRSGAAVIPSTAVDVKVVKCWYQAGSAGYSHAQQKEKKVLVPELLLNDDSLVKVDVEKQENHLKLSFPNGPKYVWISDPAPPKERVIIRRVDEFPVRDSPVLLPVDIPANANKQFWVTVHVPDAAAPGLYEGRLDLVSGADVVRAVRLRLKVLPVKLLAPYYTSSLYYEGVLDPEGKGSISSMVKSELQYRRELQNLIAHGVTHPVLCLPRRRSGARIYAEDLLRRSLDIRGELGMIDGEPIYPTRFYFRALELKQPKLVTRIDLTPELREHLQREVRRLIDIVRSYGATDVYFYGLDEAKGARLTCQRESWEAIREAGGKIFVAGYMGANFTEMGDIQDLLICAGAPSREEADRWHSKGHQIWCYANPQGGLENPEAYRRNFGLLLWRTRYDGAATWAYQSTGGCTWNDFDGPKARGYNFAYPTVDGVIDTIQWEGYREGVDDVRYVTTLEKAIETAKRSGDEGRKASAAAAERYLRDLDVETRELETIRLEIIEHLLALAGQE